MAALEALSSGFRCPQQAVRQGFADGRDSGALPGAAGRPTTILDVAHNPHAAAVLAQNLEQHGIFRSLHAVFGMAA